MTPNSDQLEAPVAAASSVLTSSDQRPQRLLMRMRDANLRPIIHSLADVVSVIEREGFKPIGDLMGGAADITNWGSDDGALVWVDGETECERFRVAVPISKRLSGVDREGLFHETSITSFNGSRILADGSLELAGFPLLRRVRFELSAIRFLLTETEREIARLLRSYLGLNLPREALYTFPDEAKLSKLQPFLDYIALHWLKGSTPSRETVAKTLEVLGIRSRCAA